MLAFYQFNVYHPVLGGVGSSPSAVVGFAGRARMPLDTSALRTAEDSFPPIKDRIVRLIRIANHRVTQAYTVTDKREMLGSLKPADTLLALWSGQWHTDVFQMPKEMVAQWRKELLG